MANKEHLLRTVETGGYTSDMYPDSQLYKTNYKSRELIFLVIDNKTRHGTQDRRVIVLGYRTSDLYRTCLGYAIETESIEDRLQQEGIKTSLKEGVLKYLIKDAKEEEIKDISILFE